MADNRLESAETTEDQQKTKQDKPYLDLHQRALSWTLEDELKRNPKIASESVQELRDWITENKIDRDADITITDRLLVAFLHSCDSNIERTKSVIKMYCSTRKSTPEVFADRAIDSDEVQRAHSVGYFVILPNKTPEGHRVILQRLRDTDPDKFVHSTFVKMELLAMDAIIAADPTAEGYAFLCDFQGSQMAHLYKQGILLSRKLLKYAQEGQPIRIRKICFINANSIMSKLMTIVRPFMSKELYNMIEIYTPDQLKDILKSIPSDCLPNDYGGKLESLDTLNEYTLRWLKQMEQDSLIPS